MKSSAVSVTLRAREMRSNAAGFRALANLHDDLGPIERSVIHLDCSVLSWMDAHLAAPFLTIIKKSAARGNSHQLKNLADRIRVVLAKNGALKEKEVDVNRTTMPITHFPLNANIDFANYTRRHINRQEMPQMSEALQGKFFEGIDELFANCSIHSRSTTDISVGGQFFPRHEKLAFVISDGGIGIAGSLHAAGFTFESASEAIGWAMEPNNTSRSGDIPGGLGLNLIRKFVEANRGTLLVVSHCGVWTQAGPRVESQNLRLPFPGTSVILEINTADRKRYDLVKRTDPNSIW